ncbi:hypothetical protein H6F46_00615 [Limnothrix sp. FACHB-1083]|uniref:hypothetical protein n=1 Tax=unclassified Limnothrix TaxID=2632864 RepID=UPI0016815650|nr:MULTISPECIES: hypothetical protein [unclassified Limnothrix]MBD2159187.1 hypothetical protein [Limnothrix sp. FACHB-1083]MBD2191892.1 hypothetical protein [Limnothrix sp. FACHB-1088]
MRGENFCVWVGTSLGLMDGWLGWLVGVVCWLSAESSAIGLVRIFGAIDSMILGR